MKLTAMVSSVSNGMTPGRGFIFLPVVLPNLSIPGTINISKVCVLEFYSVFKCVFVNFSDIHSNRITQIPDMSGCSELRIL